MFGAIDQCRSQTTFHRRDAAVQLGARSVGNKELAEYMEVKGYADAANWVYRQALETSDWSNEHLIGLTELRLIHQLALRPAWGVAPHPNATESERPGAFREHDIQPFPGGMQPPPWPEVPAQIHDWLAEAQKLGHGEPFPEPETLARSHARFEQIHPFLDGNGRTGRLVLNLLLVRLGYPPAMIYKGERTRYLAALRRAGRCGTGAAGAVAGARNRGAECKCAAR